MEKDTHALFFDKLDDLDALTAAQLTEIVTALKAYQFPAGSDSSVWRDNMVAAIEAGDFSTASSGAAALVMGTVSIEPCP